MAALWHHVADHPRDWDLFKNALTYAYNTQTQRVNKLSPFEFVLSRPPSSLALQSQTSISQLRKSAHSHSKSREWLSKLIVTARTETARAQPRYKHDFDKKISIPFPVITEGTYVFLPKEYINPRKDKKHKLSAIQTVPYRVVEVNEDSLGIEDEDTNERISRDRVVLAAAPRGFRVTPENLSGEKQSLTNLEARSGAELTAPDLSANRNPLEDLPPRRFITNTAQIPDTGTMHPQPLLNETRTNRIAEHHSTLATTPYTFQKELTTAPLPPEDEETRESPKPQTDTEPCSMPPTTRKDDYGKSAPTSEEESNSLPTGARPQS